MEASREFEVFVGSDGVVRINVDGLCALRVRMDLDCRLVFRTPDAPAIINHSLVDFLILASGENE